jgi:hypothetical protein
MFPNKINDAPDCVIFYTVLNPGKTWDKRRSYPAGGYRRWRVQMINHTYLDRRLGSSTYMFHTGLWFHCKESGRCKEEIRFGSSFHSQQPDTAPYSSPAAPIPYAYNINVSSILIFFFPHVCS